MQHIAGLYPADQVWLEWLRGMPRGALDLNTSGLTRANPYWAGALALLATNVAAVTQSQGKESIADCLRNGLLSIGNTTIKASTQALVNACDSVLGQPLLSEFAKAYQSPAAFNLPELWQKLGILQSNASIVFSDNPDHNKLRAAILAPPNGFVAPPLPPGIARLN